KALAPSLSAGIGEGEPAAKRQRVPTPSDAPRHARLATAAKGSAGSGLIDVQELARLQDEKAAADEAVVSKGNEAVAEAALEAMNSSASRSGASLSGSGLRTPSPTPAPHASGADLQA